jgi:hypothetical protein
MLSGLIPWNQEMCAAAYREGKALLFIGFVVTDRGLSRFPGFGKSRRHGRE